MIANYARSYLAERGYDLSVMDSITCVDAQGIYHFDPTDARWVAEIRRLRERRGLGDRVERVLNATGIGPIAKQVIHRVTGKPCNCAERKAALNRIWPG